MDSLEERQVEALCWLNDNDVEPNYDCMALAEFFGLKFVSVDGWSIIDE